MREVKGLKGRGRSGALGYPKSVTRSMSVATPASRILSQAATSCLERVHSLARSLERAGASLCA